jgi:hypothetical protein
MKNAVIVVVLTAMPVTLAHAQGTKYYVGWDDAAKKCIVVENTPTTNKVEGGGPFNSKAEAEAAFKKVKGCSPESMKK